MKKIALIFFLLLTVSAIGQKTMNNYKYIIINEKFPFFKEVDKYQTSSLMKFLFKKNGFKSFLNSDILPDDYNKNRCLALNAELKNESGLFSTKVFFELKDCNRSLIYKSEIGKSRIKKYKKSYQEAIRKAFISFKKLNYSYTPLSQPISNNDNKKLVVEQMSTRKNDNQRVSVLYAQEIVNGFQLVNTKPEKVFIILKTKAKDIFIIKDKNGILYKNGNNWIAEYYAGAILVRKEYQIKF